MGAVREIHELEQLNQASARVRTQLDRWEGQAEVLDQQITETSEMAVRLHAQVDLYTKVGVALEVLGEKWRGGFESVLAGITGQGLSAIFQKKMEVFMETTTKRKSASLDIELETDGQRTRIMGAKGGSVVNIMVAFLRMIMTMRDRRQLRRFGAWDEPFNMVSAKFRPALCDTLKEIREQLGFQLLISSHEDEMLDAADTAYLVRLVAPEVSEVKRLKSAAEEGVTQ